MKNRKDLTYYHDINFEWLASYLTTNNDLDIFHMMIQPIGIFGRHVNHDVEAIHKIDIDGVSTLKFELNRDGLYDNLPHGVFHKSQTTKSFKETNEEVKESIKIENEKESHARKFFQIFESEILKTNVVNRSVVLNAEQRDFGFAFDQLVQLLPFQTEIFEKQELVKIMQLFPFLNNVYDDYVSNLENALEYILCIDTTCCFLTRESCNRQVEVSSNNLGENELGWNLCCGQTLHVLEEIASITYYPEEIIQEETSEKIKVIAEWVLPMFYNIEINTESKMNHILDLNENAILN